MQGERGEVRGRRRGVVGVAVRDGRLLVIRRSQYVEAPGAYCFPGGAVDAGETEEDALRREFQEELNATVRPLRFLWRAVTSWDVDLSWWLVSLESEHEMAPHPREVESIHWFTPQELRALPKLLESNRQFLEAAASGAFDVAGVDFSGK